MIICSFCQWQRSLEGGIGSVSPRGVAIPEVREQLFRAAVRVLSREGPDGLTGRAITDEAGVATGVLYKHFADFDAFLAELILERARGTAQQAAQLPSAAGTGTVAGNLAEVVTSLLKSDAFAMAGIVISRPSLMARIQELTGGAPSPLDEIETAFAAYLDAERTLGRLTSSADSEGLAIALVGAVHHLFLTNRTTEPNIGPVVHRIVDALISSAAPNEAHDRRRRSK
jgi:AcrR family transcriptional regulator